jgi:hypothetical protein
MNYFEDKQLQDREARTIAGGFVLICVAPFIGFVIGVLAASPLVLFSTWAIISLFGVLGIKGALKDRRERKANIITT